MTTIPSIFHIDANRMISSACFARFTIINCPLDSISAERQFSEEEIKKSSSVRPSYFSCSWMNTPMIPERFCASKIPAMLGIYCRRSSSAITR